eukprot:Skav236654  [mRNA]  locus=scaffold691:275582:279691:- [translate_table: standard]
MPLHLSHVESRKDVFDCNLRRKDGLFLCPITGDELGSAASKRSARVLRPCGCIISQAAAELGTGSCEACGQEVTDFVTLGASIKRRRRPELDEHLEVE